MQGVAARARTGRATLYRLYRRWAGKRELVAAALRHGPPPLPEPRANRSARENLLATFAAYCDLLAGKRGLPDLVVMGQLI